MDTNQLVELIQLLASQQKSVMASNGSQITLIIAGMIVTAIPPTLVAWFAFLQAKAAVKAGVETKAVATEVKDIAVESKKAVVEAAASVDKVSSAVNGERHAVLETVRAQRDEIRKLSEEVATLLESQRASHSLERERGRERAPELYSESLLKAVQELTSEMKSRKTE